MPIREILVEWDLPQGDTSRTVMYFDAAAASIAQQRAALDNFCASNNGALNNSVAWRIQTSGRELDDLTGTLFGAWTEPTVYDGTGTLASPPVADATQILYQWRTSVIVNGRFLRGRTFIPGCAQSSTAMGNLAPTVVAALTSGALPLINSAVGFGIWHRPRPGNPGNHVAATDVSVWSELAVLRRRRR